MANRKSAVAYLKSVKSAVLTIKDGISNAEIRNFMSEHEYANMDISLRNVVEDMDLAIKAMNTRGTVFD